MLKKLIVLGLMMALRICPANAQDKAVDLAIIVAKDSTLTDLASQDLARIFEEEKSKDPDGHKWVIVMREPGSPERATALEKIYQMDEDTYATYFLRAVFAGRAQSKPKEFANAAALREFVAATPGAIGLLRAADADASVKILKVDGKAPGDADYGLKIK